MNLNHIAFCAAKHASVVLNGGMMQHTLLCQKVVIVFMQLFIQCVLLSTFCTVPGYMLLPLICNRVFTAWRHWIFHC